MGMTILVACGLLLIGLPVTEAAPTKEALTEQCRKHTEKFEYPEAIDACGKAIGLDGKYADAYFWRGIALVATRQYDKALADFTQVIALSPTDVQALSNRGLVYRRLKQFDLALKDLNQAIEIDPAYAPGTSAVMPAHDLTLHAVWGTKTALTITSNGGRANFDDSDSDSEDEAPAPKKPAAKKK